MILCKFYEKAFQLIQLWTLSAIALNLLRNHFKFVPKHLNSKSVMYLKALSDNFYRIACYLRQRQLQIFLLTVSYAIFISPLCKSADFLTLSIHIVFLRKCYSQAASYMIREHATNSVSSVVRTKGKKTPLPRRCGKRLSSTLYSENNNSAASSGNLFCSFLITTSRASDNEREEYSAKYFDYVMEQ